MVRGIDASRGFYERPSAHHGVGSVEMWCDDVDVLSQPSRRMALRCAYEAWRA